jgi:catechol 2,3-dioxygenase-like lactoylglutathione lyase family enzyme
MSETTKTRITDLRTVGIPVTDQNRAVEFYVAKLGFEKRMDVPIDFGPGGRWIVVAPPGAATTIALVLASEGAPAGVDTGIRLTSEDAGADHADLRARGVDVDSEVMRLGTGVPPMFTFRDPDGNRLVIVEES